MGDYGRDGAAIGAIPTFIASNPEYPVDHGKHGAILGVVVGIDEVNFDFVGTLALASWLNVIY